MRTNLTASKIALGISTSAIIVLLLLNFSFQRTKTNEKTAEYKKTSVSIQKISDVIPEIIIADKQHGLKNPSGTQINKRKSRRENEFEKEGEEGENKDPAYELKHKTLHGLGHE